MKERTEPGVIEAGREKRVGFDIGRVLIYAGDGRRDTSFLAGTDQDAVATPPMPGAFEVIREVTELLDGRTWLISKCGPNVQRRTLAWLRAHRFYEKTGVRPDQVVFCRKRADKAPHAKRLRLAAFVDDRMDVHDHLRGVVPVRILFGPQRPGLKLPDGVLWARDWVEVRSILISMLQGAPQRTRPVHAR